MQVEFVLSQWLKEEVPIIQQKIDKSIEAIESFATIGIDKTMTEINHLTFSLK
jgi:PTH1 family peptidyl-tRNA hydrolase